MVEQKLGEIYVSGIGKRLPSPTSVTDAIEQRICTSRDLFRTEIEGVCISDGESGPEMAAHAGQEALRRARCDPAGVSLLLHTNTYYQGHDMWAPASYVHFATVDNTCPAVEVHQMSNGGMAALGLAVDHLAAREEREHVLITTGDRFALPGFDRWRSDPGTVYADGGTAAVLSRRHGLAQLLSLVTVSDSGLEGMQRGKEPFAPAPLNQGVSVDVNARRRAFVADAGLDSTLKRLKSGQSDALKRALSDAGAEISEIAWFVLPHIGRARLNEQFFNEFDIAPERTTWSWGRGIGHLGAGDQFAGLGHLMDTGQLNAGDLCVLIGVGAGFSWSVAVLRIPR